MIGESLNREQFSRLATRVESRAAINLAKSKWKWVTNLKKFKRNSSIYLAEPTKGPKLKSCAERGCSIQQIRLWHIWSLIPAEAQDHNTWTNCTVSFLIQHDSFYLILLPQQSAPFQDHLRAVLALSLETEPTSAWYWFFLYRQVLKPYSSSLVYLTCGLNDLK